MIRRRALMSTALAATAVLGIAACSDDTDPEATAGPETSDGGGEGPAALTTVTVSEDLDAEPEIDIEPPVEIAAADAMVVVPGDGDAIGEGDLVICRSVYVDAESGEVLQSWWQGAPAGSVHVDAEQIGEQAAEFFTTVAVGSRFAMAGWQSTAEGEAFSLIQVGDIDRVVGTLRAEGEEQEPSGDFPAVSLGDDGAPALEGAPEGEPPTETVREALILGEGEETREGDYLTMHYTGWSWDTGEEFDSSWERGVPFSFAQGSGAVIPGWDENLLDLPVGSQVMLVVPPSDAYGDDPEKHELGGQTLVFVVDVLDAAPTVD